MKIKNTKQTVDTWVGQEIQPDTYYTIEAFEQSRWANDSKVLTDIGSGDLLLNDEIQDVSDVATAIDILKGNEVTVRQKDASTGGLATSPKWAPDGWSQVYHEIEFQTSKLNSIHDRDYLDQDKGFTTSKFFNAAGDELTTQIDIDANCVRTHIDFVPNHYYGIKSGRIAQIIAPVVPIYIWCIGAPDVLNLPFCEGGINLEFLEGKNLVGLEGTAATILPAGLGLRFVIRHPAGHQHRVQAIFEYFKA